MAEENQGPVTSPAENLLDTEANYIVAWSPKKITGVTLIPKTKLRTFIGSIPQPYHFTALYALAGEKDLVTGLPGLSLKQLEWYEPKQIVKSFVDSLYYHWMGKTAPQIDADINTAIESLRAAKKLRGY